MIKDISWLFRFEWSCDIFDILTHQNPSFWPENKVFLSDYYGLALHWQGYL